MSAVQNQCQAVSYCKDLENAIWVAVEALYDQRDGPINQIKKLPPIKALDAALDSNNRWWGMA